MPEIIVKMGDRILHRYFFEKDFLSVGRARDNDIVIENLSVSRNHARINVEGGKFILSDLGSSNGTLLNGVRITKAELKHDDHIAIGKHSLHFLNEQEDGAAPDLGSQVGAGFVPVLTVLKGRQKEVNFRVTRSEMTIGRAPSMDIRIHDWTVSRKHAVIRREGDGYRIIDLDSWRGVTVNGNASKDASIKDGDEIVIGNTILSFRLVHPDDLPAVESCRVPAPAAAAPAKPGSVRLESQTSSIEDEFAPLVEEPSAEVSPRTNAVDDEFAPLSEEELEALEEEADLLYSQENAEERAQREAWEMLEAEKMLGGMEDLRKTPLVESDDELRAQEEAAIDRAELDSVDERFAHHREDDEEELAEERALYGGPISDKAPFGEPDEQEPSGVHRPTAKPAAAPMAPPMPKPAESSAPKTTPVDASKSKEIALWEKALKNKSALIRKNAAKELKKLTGKDYDWTTEPGEP